jgi:ankyrin repeat protein
MQASGNENMPDETDEEAVFADERFQTDQTLDENKIQRYILSCIGGLLSLQTKRDSIGKVESRLFFRTLSTVGGAFSSSKPDLVTERQDLISRFMIRSYLDVESTNQPGGDTDWHKEHWACLLVADSGLQDDDELKDMLMECPAALTKVSVAIPAYYLAIAATTPHSIPDIVRQETIEYYCPRLAHLTDAIGETALHYAARYSRSADVLGWILGMNPKAVKAASKDRGDTPLHQLVGRKCFFPDLMSMLRQLLHADMSAALVKNSEGNTPLHLFCMPRADLGGDGNGTTLMAMRMQLLEKCPAAALIANSKGRLPLHEVLVGEDSDTTFLQQLIAAYPEGLQCSDKNGLLPIHWAAAKAGTLEMLTTVLDAYPEAVSANVPCYGTPLHQAAYRSDAAGPTIVRYLYERFPAAIKAASSDDGWYPLHHAAKSGSYAVLTLVHSLYPEAISIATTDRFQNVPLHVFVAERELRNLCSADADMLRYLLRHYPAAVTIPAGPNDGNKNVYEMALENEYSDSVHRLLLRAAPELDPDELHELNYAERRMALFLAHCAISKTGDHSKGGSSFMMRLRALARRNMGELFHEIVSFL